MATLKKYNIEGNLSGEESLADSIANAEANGQSIKDYIVAIRANARQWSACTRDRSEVNHSGQKPHKQKGGGRARQGSLASPQYKGGGVVFGPKPKFDQHVRINRKERRQAVRALIADKVRAEKVLVIEDAQFDAPKTKRLATFLKNAGVKGRTLFLSNSEADANNFARSLRNLPKVAHNRVANVSGYDVMIAGTIVFTESALAELNGQEKGRK